MRLPQCGFQTSFHETELPEEEEEEETNEGGHNEETGNHHENDLVLL
jgi:hypothetical protein